MKLAYLMNQHPYASCTFIRREILELEAQGVAVSRFSIRYPELTITDQGDQQELTKTRFILTGGMARLGLGLLKALITRPQRWLQTLGLTLSLARRSDRGLGVNLAYLAEACVLLDWLQAAGITHVHCHFATNATAVAMLCHSLGGPSYSFTVHGPHEFDQPEAISLGEKITRAAFVVAISSFTRSQLLRWCSYQHWSKIHIVHCGVDQLFLAPPPTPLPPTPVFVCVGRISEQKGHLILLEAVSWLANQQQRFKVVLVGDGPLRSQLEALIAQLKLHDYIEITGWATNAEVQQHILKAQVMVVPSFAEGLPVVVMEALALGRPVLATYIAGMAELVEPGVCGWLVPAGSAQPLADAMARVIHTPLETLTQMGQAGAQRVVQNHSAAVEAGKLKQLLGQYA
ncbi:MAG: glycosyltransferase family 4 protein [Cyanobacteria bacterium REEB459]|nr:glycosyltransferase family 4 protein [Cyanobacteria bacterium REEB459]